MSVPSAVQLTEAEQLSLYHVIVGDGTFTPGDVYDAVERILADRADETTAQVLRDAAADLRASASLAWGGDATWVTSGARVADLAASWLEESADEVES